MTADAVGGVWDHALELSRALAARGTTVDLAVLGPPPDAARLAAAGRIAGLRVHPVGGALDWTGGPTADWDGRLLALERASAPDVIHANGYGEAILPWRAPVLLVAHSDVETWWRAVRGRPAPDAWSPYRRTVAAALRAAAAVVAPSRAMADALEAAYRVRPLVVSNARDPAGWRPGRKRPVLLAAGRLWDAGKDVALLDRIAPALPWPVRAAGPWRAPDGGGRRPRRLTVLGPLAPRALAAEMAKAAIFAHPARYEPFGLAVLEAALAGCALALADIPSLRETWDGAALFLPPGDAAAWRRGLSRLCADADRRATLARAARRRAHRFAPSRQAAAYAALYRSLVARPVAVPA